MSMESRSSQLAQTVKITSDGVSLHFDRKWTKIPCVACKWTLACQARGRRASRGPRRAPRAPAALRGGGAQPEAPVRWTGSSRAWKRVKRGAAISKNKYSPAFGIRDSVSPLSSPERSAFCHCRQSTGRPRVVVGVRVRQPGVAMSWPAWASATTSG